MKNKTKQTKTKMQAPENDPAVFGGCPVVGCGRNDGYLNVESTHVFLCRRHKTAWVTGFNLFSSWRFETEKDWAENLALLEAEYREVEPVYPKLIE